MPLQDANPTPSFGGFGLTESSSPEKMSVVTPQYLTGSTPPEATPVPAPQYLSETIPPCTPVEGVQGDPCAPDRDTDGGGSASYYPLYPPGMAPESFSAFLEGTSRGTVPHIVLRGTFLPNTVRCDASYTYNQPSYLDPQHGAEYYSWTLEESTILYCFVDVRLGEYFVGSGPPTLTLVATHDLFVPSDGKPGSLAAFANLWERVLIEGGEAIPEEVIDNALGPGTVGRQR